MKNEFAQALASAKIKILKYDPSKSRCITLSSGGSTTIEKFADKLKESLGADVVNYPEVLKSIYDQEKLVSLIHSHCKETNVLKEEKTIEVPEKYKDLVLNMDESSTNRDNRFFMTRNEIRSVVSGAVYMSVCGMADNEASLIARKVIPEYRPRSEPGVTKQVNPQGEEMEIFNDYVPPAWMKYEGKVPDKLPPLFEKLVNHIIPSKLEREYFYSWLHDSLFSRSYVYLILCGKGGNGKNRLKLVLRALHGFDNTVDGKKSTLTERFNSQLADVTLAWFDELHYNSDMENAMKEIQNDTISIEKKNVDASRSTKIYSSLIISNNKPRDNYIAFDARKFAPISISSERLETSMSYEEIDELSRKVQDWSSPDFDVEFLAQIGRWLKKHGRSSKWPMLEYKGPMFYKLAHTSMSRWQKKAASLILEGKLKNSSKIVLDPKRGFLWSTVEETSMKKNGDRSLQFPDYTTVSHFFEIFVDAQGKPAFKVTPVPGSILSDFYVKLINPKARILTEAEVIEEMGVEEDEETEYDL